MPRDTRAVALPTPAKAETGGFENVANVAMTTPCVTQEGIFAAMLAELDTRIDDIIARTDRLLAHYG
jgi:hypothetical protein